MLRFEAEPTREPEPSPAYGNDVFRAAMRAHALDIAGRPLRVPVMRPDGFVLVADPCGCDFCANFGTGSQWTAEQVEDFAARARARIMAGVDMPGRIVDDVRPDQRGGE